MSGAQIPEDVSNLWKSLDPAIRAALIESETKSNNSAPNNNKDGLQGRRANAGSGPQIDTKQLIGGGSFVKREVKPGWIKVREDVYDTVKSKREEELSKKVPVDISVVLPDGKELSEDKVSLLNRIEYGWVLFI